jgi:hypothetical protein
MEEIPEDKVPIVEDYAILKEFEDVFKEISRFPPKRDIGISTEKRYRDFQGSL